MAKRKPHYKTKAAFHGTVSGLWAAGSAGSGAVAYSSHQSAKHGGDYNFGDALALVAGAGSVGMGSASIGHGVAARSNYKKSKKRRR